MKHLLVTLAFLSARPIGKGNTKSWPYRIFQDFIGGNRWSFDRIGVKVHTLFDKQIPICVFKGSPFFKRILNTNRTTGTLSSMCGY